MRLLVTGGTGFVMSHVLRNWLTDHPDATAISVDIAPPDDLAEAFFAPVRRRLEVLTGDVRDPGLLGGVPDREAVTHIVCGAAMTPTVGTTEKSQAAMIAGVNMMGPVHCLELARSLPGLQRMVHVSTGSVYGDDGPADGAPLPEDGYVRPFPSTLYPITKLTGELLATRWKELFDLPLHIVRLASVYGPMDRWTPGRDFACAPNVMVHKALAGESWTIAGADAVGDFIHGGDVGRALCALLTCKNPRHSVYNIGHGAPATLGRVADLVAAAVPGSSWTRTERPDEADIVGDERRKSGAWGAYSIERLTGDTGWTPTPLAEAIADYVHWVRTVESA